MAKIIISELSQSDSESFLTDLHDGNYRVIHGGNGYDIDLVIKFAKKSFEFMLVVFAIYSIVNLVDSYTSNSDF
ncbi:hypothetical protein [Nostoc sp. TCL26-01]|uniref:hypothetical protein n=1 Tax=Nostoc sp. TCL26-01 TaxID=2576904 RepID=UPI0015C07BCD|nr:hypothetical protein [Nostoc sp. TCL26-01]QLE56328.1 hypothetical protein FD725_12755 [Nostoc sp. TCL26-01]